MGCFVYNIHFHSISLTGEHNRNVNEGIEQRFKAKRAFTHPNYNKQPLDSDIALIKLDRPVRFNSRIQPICLPQAGRSVPPGSLCYITGKCCIRRGWGEAAWEYPDFSPFFDGDKIYKIHWYVNSHLSVG